VGQLTHAYIFEGPAGVGKFTTAQALAKALVCGNRGCNRCEDCVRLDHGTHPGVISVIPQGVTLGIDQVREIARQVILKPAEGTWKIFIIDDADAMTVQAANAFLRTLEEPPPGVLFVLVTSNVHGMLPTIRSRCQELTFNAIPGRDIAALLRERFGFDADEADLATRVSGGVVGKALALVRGPGMARRDQVLSLASDLGVLDSLDLMNAAEALATSVRGGARQDAESKEAIEEAEQFALDKRHASFIRRTLEQRAKRDVAQRERIAFEDALSVLDSWFRDLVVAVEGAEELLVNLDRREAIERCAKTTSSETALGCIAMIERARRMIRHNVNPQLALEAMLLDIQECDPCNVS
jgi:DNA polymerase-3 subunit delta'